MKLTGLKFHHLGLAVRNDKEALTMLDALGYTPHERVFDPHQNVYVRLCTAEGQPAIEIVQPGETDKSPIDPLISKYNELIYHTCYETPDLATTLQEIEGSGLRYMTIAERKPAALFGGRHVSFHKVFGWGILELLERS
ncbi:MAG: VOC family protein [Alphaproteobacteria bacterium]